MMGVLKENIKKKLRRHASLCGSQILLSYVIIIVNIAVVVSVAITMFRSTSYTPDQLSYNIPCEKIGYTNSGPQCIFSYGPYISLDKGNYKVTIYYETDTDTTYDICYVDEDGKAIMIKEGTLESDKNSKTCTICNQFNIDNDSFEVRTYYQGTGFLQINGIAVGHFFSVNKYMFVTLATIIVSLFSVRGRSLQGLLDKSRKVLYFVGFYAVIICLCLYSTTYLVEREKVWFYSILNVLIVLHTYGAQMAIYDNDIVVRNTPSIVSYAFQFYSLYRLDKVMQGIVSQNQQQIYADNIPYIFTFCIITCIVLVVALIKKLWMKRVVFGFIYYTFVILLAVQDIYYQVFTRLFSFKDMQLASEGGSYAGYVLGLIDAKFWTTFIPLVVIGAVGIYTCKYTFPISRNCGIAFVSVVAVGILYINTVYTKDYGDRASFEDEVRIYDSMYDRERAYKLCGFYQYELKDMRKTVLKNFRGNRKQKAEVVSFFEDREEDGVYNTNSMTGILKGKNVIFVLMESIDDIACREDVMPTLYRMSKEGICFTNMYASIYGSAATMNSETVTNIGNYAPQDGSIISSFSDNYFPYSLACRFTNAGYVARQYHANYPKFYNRDMMHRAFGYKEYVCFRDYISEEAGDPGLDTVLVENDGLYYTLIQDEKFFDYIISYTAHLPYDKADGYVRFSMERHPEYEELTYSEEINNYFAKARITDDMLSGLIQRLEEDGLMENTVIVAMGDHYPYGLADKDALYDLSGVDRYEQLLYKVPFVVWTPGIEPMQIDKIASSIDVVPTIVNLMGLGDYSMYIGHDIFNEKYDGYAYFSDGSWLGGDSYYYQGKLVKGTMDGKQIADMCEKVQEMISTNDNILHTDYWRNIDKFQ